MSMSMLPLISLLLLCLVDISSFFVDCDGRANVLVSILEDFADGGVNFESTWRGNNPCSGTWHHIWCDDGNITRMELGNLGLEGTISPKFAMLTSLKKLVLSHNKLNGTIPTQLAKLPNLTMLDVSYNRLHGKVPEFRKGVTVLTTGNIDIEQNGRKSFSASTKKIIAYVIAAVCGFGIISLVLFFLYRKQNTFSNNIVQQNHQFSTLKSHYRKLNHFWPSRRYDAGRDMHTVFSFQALRDATNNFDEKNMLGKGGSGTVYKGRMKDEREIAVKRILRGTSNDKKAQREFESEMGVLTKVRHRHLVALLGYCLDGNEKILVYEYVAKGTLSRFLFNWEKERVNPLNWTRRLTIALDVGRAIEYLHSLATNTYIHRDLKPSNILLDKNMRAKVADFGLARLVVEEEASISSQMAGTFGYIAPEYATTGKASTKVDVYAFGVILLEIITGRKAVEDDTSHSLVAWFLQILKDKKSILDYTDKTLNFNDDGTAASIQKVADLARLCTEREAHDRPDMSYAVSVLSSLVGWWEPTKQEEEENNDFEINLQMRPPQHLDVRQAENDTSNTFYSCCNNFTILDV